MSDFFRKHSMITGTLLLTAAGFAVRILGFFYRIFLSRTIGAEGLGLYNLVHPLYGICLALCAGSIQTAISRCIAANLSRRKLFLRTGLMISLSIAALLAMILYAGSQFLANQILLESRCGEFLRLMALSIPFSAIHACVNGYYYGMQRTRVPAASQITEQLIRMGVVFLLVLFFQAEQIPITTELAVLGHLAGEAGSCFYAALTFLIFDHTVSSPCLPLTSSTALSTLCAGRELMSMALPRVRDFRGCNPNSFDGRGNYTMGLTEQLIFPEIEYDKIDHTRGMDITFVTTAETNEAAKALMDAMGFPFKKEN